MRIVATSLLLSVCSIACSKADLTIVQKVEGSGPAVEMTIKIKGDKARIDSNPNVSTIVDSKSGEIINLMQSQKKIVRISADKMKAAVDMLNKYSGADKKGGAGKPKLVATGKKERINGYDTDQYLYEAPNYKATYWLATSYPGGAAILKQLQALNPGLWSANQMNMPDYREFPGVPIKTVLSAMGNEITTSLVSVNQDPVSDSEFVPPKDFQEIKLPDLNNLLNEGSPQPPTSGSP